MKTFILIVFALLLFFQSRAQQKWVDMMQQPGENFYKIQAVFNDYWKDKDISAPGSGYKPFKRWEHFVEPRVYPSGDLSLISTTWKNYEDFLKQRDKKKLSSSNMISSTTWTAVGPMGPMTGVATNGFPRKAGRDNFITFDPSQPGTIWMGTPAGGLWHTTNNGASWVTNTDNLPIIGCSDLAIDPTNSNILYLATGDGDGGNTNSIGVLKSTDGGLTWNPTGLTYSVSQQVRMRRLIIHPTNPQILLAATSAGIQRTTNGGTSWSMVVGINTYDLEFKPGNPNIVYAGGTSFYRSINGGVSFSLVTTASNSNRMSVAVTAADTNYVYVLASSNSSNGFRGLYRSTNGAATFSQMSATPNILGNACNGSSTDGQGWFDLALAVSPTNKKRITVGGVNVWESDSSGATGSWACIGCWIGTNSPSPYLKADHHDLDYSPSGILYVATDGGLFSYTGNSWTDLNAQRNIAQIYKIGLSSLSTSKWITGHQDNGTNIYTGTTYTASMAGDGMDCFIDRTNDLNMFASNPNAGFSRSTSGGTSWSNIINGLSGNGGWVSPWKQDPMDSTRLYAGLSKMFVSNNLGSNWTSLTVTGGSGFIKEFAIAPSNNLVIYVLQGSSIRKTIDGGTTWANVTGTLPANSTAPTFITISPTDPDKAWVTLSGYSLGNKVYQTLDGGTTWSNVSFNLPNIPANCSVYQSGTSDRIYVGMDVGVYYKDAGSQTWSLYNTGLPNVPVSDLEISPAAPGLLRAATYGRGVYEVDVIPAPVQAPASNFSVIGIVCSDTEKQFTDNSAYAPSSWSWSVAPSAGVIINSSSSQNPNIIFTISGTYTVSMVASNTVGSGNVITQTVNVLPSPDLTLSASNTLICLNDSADITASGADSYTWVSTFVPGSILPVNTDVAGVFSYTCSSKSNNGCYAKKTITVEVSECLGVKETGLQSREAYSIYPNPASTKLTVINNNYTGDTVHFEIIDATGKIVLQQQLSFKSEKNAIQVNVSLLAPGVYFAKLSGNNGSKQAFRLVKE